jgi:hypothetical protein
VSCGQFIGQLEAGLEVRQIWVIITPVHLSGHTLEGLEEFIHSAKVSRG